MPEFSFNTKYPSISDLKRRAKKRIPSFAFDYVDGGIDEEKGKSRNREAFHKIELTPRYLRNASHADTRTELFGHTYNLGFGIPPIGLGNMMWPNAEHALATAAQRNNIPYVLSTFSTTLLEDIAEIAPDVCWYQLYTPKDESSMKDIIARVKAANYNALVITLDIAVGAKRNRELKNGLKLPFQFSPKIIYEALTHPRWTLETLKYGQPDFVNILKYKKDSNIDLGAFISDFNMAGVTKERIAQIRKLWSGPLILKGIQHPENALEAIELGVDGIIISNHGGRQLDAAPSSIDSLLHIQSTLSKAQLNKLAIMLDSGIRTGLDVVRAKSLGAQMMFSGRSFFWGVGAMGQAGANQVIEIYRDEITRTLKQLGSESFAKIDSSWLSHE